MISVLARQRAILGNACKDIAAFHSITRGFPIGISVTKLHSTELLLLLISSLHIRLATESSVLIVPTSKAQRTDQAIRIMLLTKTTILELFFLAVVYWAGRTWLHIIRYKHAQAQLGCPPLRRYPGWDRVLGLDYVYAMMKALKEDRFLDFQDETYSMGGSKNQAWTANFLGNRMVYSSASENLKALSTSHREYFAIEPIRVGNGAVTPFTGRGVSLSDGKRWQASRGLVMPYFDRAAFSNLERLGGHVDRLLGKIPRDGSTVDMQPLLQRWVSGIMLNTRHSESASMRTSNNKPCSPQFLDTATDFLFGETVNSLDHPEMSWPHTDMLKVHAGLRARLQLSSFVFLHHDKDWLRACKRIHGFLDSYIDKAYSQLDEERNSGKPATYSDGRPRNDFLWTIARHIPDKLELRTQLTGVWIPSNETTSILITNTIFALSHNPRVVQKLREEILGCRDQALTFERLRSLEYLRWVINESELEPFHLKFIGYLLNKFSTRPPSLPSQPADSSVLRKRHSSPQRRRS